MLASVRRIGMSFCSLALLRAAPIAESTISKATNAITTMAIQVKIRHQSKAGIAGTNDAGVGVTSGVGVGAATNTMSNALVASWPAPSLATAETEWLPGP